MRSKTELPVDCERIHQDSLNAEILRSERRRVTILAGLFVCAACIYSFIAFTPGLLDQEFHGRFRARWPWFVSLYLGMAAYEWGLRAAIGWLIEHRREPRV